MRMRDVLWQIWLNCGYFLTVAASGFFLYKLCAPFVRPRNGRFWRVLLFLTLAGSTGMVIWIGDPNLLYTLPAFFALFLLSTRGDRIGRVAVCIILFCLEMSVCALLDTYVERINRNALYDVLVRLARPLVFGPLWLLLRRRLPREPVVLSRRLWKLVLGLAAMPLCALIAVVLLTFRRYDSIEVNTVAMYQGMVVLPFVFLTSLVLLFAILILADHERLEQANRLAGLREVYYQGLRQQETQVRRLRHDLRNHLTAVRGFLEQGDEQGAIGYLDQIAGSPALRGTRRLCENEAANAVLTAKAEAMEREGVAADFAVFLPRDLPVADMDLCALLGNALDNAIEGSRGAGERRITIRCGGQGTLHAAGGEHPGRRGAAGSCNYQDGQGRPRLRHPRDAGNRRALRRHPGRRGPGQRVRAGGVPAPGRAGRNTVNPHALTAAADTGESSIFHICGVFAQKNREAVHWTVSLFRSQSGLKASSKVRSVPRRGQ